MERIADATPDTALLVVDEAYREFVTDGDVPDALALLGDRDNVAVLRTFSKAHGLAALRVGYLVAHPEVVAAVDRTLVPFAVNSVAEAAAIASLGHLDRVAARCADVVGERERVTAMLRSLGAELSDGQANFVWLPGPDAAPLGHALERAGIITRVFPEVGIRVTMGTPLQNDQFLAAYRSARATLPG